MQKILDERKEFLSESQVMFDEFNPVLERMKDVAKKLAEDASFPDKEMTFNLTEIAEMDKRLMLHITTGKTLIEKNEEFVQHYKDYPTMQKNIKILNQTIKPTKMLLERSEEMHHTIQTYLKQTHIVMREDQDRYIFSHVQ